MGIVVKNKYYYIKFTPYNRFQGLKFKTRYDRFDKCRTFWFLGMQLHLGWAYNVDWSTVQLDGVYTWDYPDFCDAYISYAQWNDGKGTELTDDELDALTNAEGMRINEMAYETLI